MRSKIRPLKTPLPTHPSFPALPAPCQQHTGRQGMGLIVSSPSVASPAAQEEESFPCFIMGSFQQEIVLH